MERTLTVCELGATLDFTFEDLMRYHGPGSPAGMATAFQVLARAFALLSPDGPPQRRSVAVRTAFRGPGVRDGIEAVTRAVTDGRYVVDRTMVRNDRGRLLEDFVFEVTIDSRAVTLVLQDGFVTAEFIDLARSQDRSPAKESRLDVLNAQLAEQIMSAPADRVCAPG